LPLARNPATGTAIAPVAFQTRIKGEWRQIKIESDRNASIARSVVAVTFPIYPARTAILSMDCQTGIVSIHAKDDKDAFLARAASVLNHARAAGMTVIHVQVGWLSPRTAGG